ncbi:hypothetical protein ACP70R_032382 [Stipagrostis hirtigluma subsp. patula]
MRLTAAANALYMYHECSAPPVHLIRVARNVRCAVDSIEKLGRLLLTMAMVRPDKRRRIMAAVLPDDLLLSEVLVHLPVKSLALFKSVCRSWRAGIADPAFVRRHLQLSRARRPPTALAIAREVDTDDGFATSGEISFHRLLLLPGPAAAPQTAELMLDKAWPEGITRLISPAHCDGLVAVATPTDSVFVCNPATGEFVALPPATHNAETDHRDELLVPPVALGFDQWRNRYVIARYFYRRYGEIFFDEETGEYTQDYDIGHEVFTLGAGGSWERTEDPPHAVGPQRPMRTRRAFYWHADVPRPRLLRFGLQDRTFDVVPRPPTGWNSVDAMTELDDGKLLCYVHAAGDASFQVWLADDDAPTLRWSLRCRIDVPDASPNTVYNLMPVMAGGDEDELVAAVGNKLCRCNVRRGAMEEVVDMANELWYARQDRSKRTYKSCISEHHLVPYIESLVSIS